MIANTPDTNPTLRQIRDFHVVRAKFLDEQIRLETQPFPEQVALLTEMNFHEGCVRTLTTLIGDVA